MLLDNQRRTVDSEALASVLTCEYWTDRLLGASENVCVRNRATWLLTANNPSFSLEIARRSIRCRIDAKTDQPWKRTKFKHPDFKDWVRAHRTELVHAVLVIVQAWIAAGRPPGTASLGSFESWASVIGGVLEHAGIPGFLGNLDELYEQADVESQEWRAFTIAWWDRYGNIRVGAADLLRLAVVGEHLSDVLGEKKERAQVIALGKALAARRDCQFGDLRIHVEKNGHTKTGAYQLVQVEQIATANPKPDPPATLFDSKDEIGPSEGD
ncbi:MAG: hypothetical protein HY292_02790 [Planctomycetes bacterium]|nr:hypothetical protein [Planctomycetota bacterium]